MSDADKPRDLEKARAASTGKAGGPGPRVITVPPEYEKFMRHSPLPGVPVPGENPVLDHAAADYRELYDVHLEDPSDASRGVGEVKAYVAPVPVGSEAATASLEGHADALNEGAATSSAPGPVSMVSEPPSAKPSNVSPRGRRKLVVSMLLVFAVFAFALLLLRSSSTQAPTELPVVASAAPVIAIVSPPQASGSTNAAPTTSAAPTMNPAPTPPSSAETSVPTPERAARPLVKRSPDLAPPAKPTAPSSARSAAPIAPGVPTPPPITTSPPSDRPND